MDYDITKSYVQTHSIKNIFKYSYYLKKILIEKLITAFDLTYVDAPIIDEYDDNIALSFLTTKSRSISFSSASIDLYLEIPIYYDMVRKYMLHKYSSYDINGIIYETPIIWRDAKLDNLTSIKYHQIEMEFNISKEAIKSIQEMEGIISKTSNALVSSIDQVNSELGFGKSVIEYFPVIQLSHLIQKYGKIKFEKLIDLYSTINKTFFLINDSKLQKVFNSLFHFLPSTHSQINHTLLLTRFEKLGITRPLIEIAFSTNYQEHLNQLNLLHHLENNTYSKLLQNNTIQDTVAIKIYVPHIVMYALDLIHIGEVVRSKWPKDFLAFIKKHGTDLA